MKALLSLLLHTNGITFVLPVVVIIYEYFRTSVHPGLLSTLLLVTFLPYLLEGVLAPRQNLIPDKYIYPYGFVLLAASVYLLRPHHPDLSSCLTVAYCSGFLGYMICIAFSDYSELIEWISSPLEYGAPPDKIKLVYQEEVDWNDEPETCSLFEFHHGEERNYGITGPITFLLMEEPPNGASHKDIVALYKEWYIGQGVKEHIQEQVSEMSNEHE
jgi:hypothetical protein